MLRTRPGHGRRRTLTATVVTVVCLAWLACGAGTALAAFGDGFGVKSFTGQVVDLAGNPETQAGSHPDVTVSFELNENTTEAPGTTLPDGAMKDVFVELPPGLIGNPDATPERCDADLLVYIFVTGGCPASAQVGVAHLRAMLFGEVSRLATPIYNMEAPEDVPARFGFGIVGSPVMLDAQIRSDGDYGVTMKVSNAGQGVTVLDVSTTFWGVPADPAHDPARGDAMVDPCGLTYGPGETTPVSVGSCPAGAPRRPFLTMPTACSSVPEPWRLRLDSWVRPGDFVAASFDHDVDGNPLIVDGCDALEFEPEASVRPTSGVADAPTGLDVELAVPQSDDPDRLGTSHLRRAVVSLPHGMSVSPSAADGLAACGLAQIALHSTSPPSCPERSRIGTVEIDTPLLDDPLKGGVFLAAQGDNPFGSLLAMYLVAEGPGVIVKLPGRIDADPATGRLTATFDNTPQLPFERLRVSLKDGPRAPLANPGTCGPKTASVELTPWSGAPSVTRSSSFSVACPGAVGFDPGFAAGSSSPAGGAFSPFVLDVLRADRQQTLSGLSLELPSGLLAKLAGVPLCSGGAADAGVCGADSRIGTATVAAGPGSTPYHLRGSVHLTGPYRGAPYGLAVSVQAKAGPLDLGRVIVRQALHVDPADAHVTVVSDSFPTILKGIPIRLRRIHVDVDRPGFMVNPTSCAQKRIVGAMSSLEGGKASVASRFRAIECSALPFTPRLRMRLSGATQRSTGGHPGLRAVLTQPAAQAGMKAVKVKLPSSLVLDADNANGLCGYEAGLKADCPAASKVGTATAWSPLLNRALRGPVHLVQGVRFDKATGARRRALPTLLVKLRGEIDIDLRAKSSVSAGRLVSTFGAIPDAPISRFRLSLKGGDGGILVVTGNRHLCRGSQIAHVETDGQNGKRRDFRVRAATPCRKRTP